MAQRITNLLKYRLERLLLRGAQYRLLLVAAGLGLISVLGGIAVIAVGSGMRLDEAIWWAFLRLSDPGYLGDDEGAGVRTVSTLLTIAGYVVFLGALVAILTQWMNETMRDLESGLTPIAQRDHFLILGWTNRTPAIVRELLLSRGRVRRFLRLRNADELRIAVLAEQVDSGLSRELRERLGSIWESGRIIFRSGTPLRLEHLQRVDFLRASAILLPAADFASGGARAADTRTIKTLLSITNQLGSRAAQELPLAVAEIFDARKVAVARRAYGGNVEILASDLIVARLIAQNVRHPGLSYVYGELLTHGRGSEIYVRSAEPVAGQSIGSLDDVYPDAIVLGLVRPDVDRTFRALLVPDPGTVIGADDRIVLLARHYDDTDATGAPGDVPRRQHTAPHTARPPSRRVLVLGWSHKAPALLQEFESYEDERFHIDVVSSVASADRVRALSRYGVEAGRIEVAHIDADYTSPAELRKLDPGGYDNIVLLASDWLETGEESDARTILGYLLLREELEHDDRRPGLLIELFDPSNLGLFRRRPGEVLISPVMLSHMLAQVALRRELRTIFDELFGPGGGEMAFRAPSLYGLDRGPYTFEAIADAVAAYGEVALGVRTGDPATEPQGGVRLNPPRDRSFEFAPDDQILVLGAGRTSAAAQGHEPVEHDALDPR